MDPGLRARFNEAWSPELYRRFLSDLERRVGCKIEFRVAETPLFLPPEFWNRLSRAAEEILERIAEPGFVAAREAEVPEQYRTPRDEALPQFAAIDFAITEDENGSLGCQCVELQGCPSLYAFQILLADVWATHLADRPDLPDSWRLFMGGFDRHRALSLVRRALLGKHEPDDVILLDIEPETQKTFPDFAVTHRWFGVDYVGLDEIEIENDQVFRRKEGRRLRVRRIYHRVIYDEAERDGHAVPYDLRQRLDVEWAPNPAWFFIWSKTALLHLDHEAVPKTRLLRDLDEIPKDIGNYVLKPLYSFAGAGVNVEPTHADVAAVPANERDLWMLQEKIVYAPRLIAPDGEKVKAEIRMMFVRPDGDEKMTLLLNLTRLGRGKMMGVDWNRDMAWTGASVAIWPHD